MPTMPNATSQVVSISCWHCDMALVVDSMVCKTQRIIISLWLVDLMKMRRINLWVYADSCSCNSVCWSFALSMPSFFALLPAGWLFFSTSIFQDPCSILWECRVAQGSCVLVLAGFQMLEIGASMQGWFLFYLVACLLFLCWESSVVANYIEESGKKGHLSVDATCDHSAHDFHQTFWLTMLFVFSLVLPLCFSMWWCWVGQVDLFSIFAHNVHFAILLFSFFFWKFENFPRNHHQWHWSSHHKLLMGDMLQPNLMVCGVVVFFMEKTKIIMQPVHQCCNWDARAFGGLPLVYAVFCLLCSLAFPTNEGKLKNNIQPVCVWCWGWSRLIAFNLFICTPQLAFYNCYIKILNK